MSGQVSSNAVRITALASLVMHSLYSAALVIIDSAGHRTKHVYIAHSWHRCIESTLRVSMLSRVARGAGSLLRQAKTKQPTYNVQQRGASSHSENTNTFIKEVSDSSPFLSATCASLSTKRERTAVLCTKRTPMITRACRSVAMQKTAIDIWRY